MTVLAKVLAKALAADLALAAFIGFALALSQIPVRAQSVADFYRGKISTSATASAAATIFMRA